MGHVKMGNFFFKILKFFIGLSIGIGIKCLATIYEVRKIIKIEDNYYKPLEDVMHPIE